MANQPMNKFLKLILWACGICAGFFILLLIAAAILIPILLPPAKLKAMATEKLTAELKHQVTIGDAHFNVLSGFDIKDLVVANRAGWASKPMVSAKDISISYHLLPLLWGKVSLGEIKLNQPDILVERRNPDQFNFSDMGGGAQNKATSAPSSKASAKSKVKKKSAKKKHKKRAELQLPDKEKVVSSFFIDSAWADTAPSNTPKSSKVPDISVDSLNIQGAHLEYLDETASPVQRAMASGLNLRIRNISLTGGKISFSLDTPFAYNKLDYKLALAGSLRYFLDGQSIKGLDLKGAVNDLGFNLSGDALNLTGDLTPTMDGEASLNMLKFAGLVPSSLSKMPEGLSLGGPAKVDFHLAGSKSKGLELSGTADGSGLAIQYKDLFVKTASTPCKVEFKSINRLNQGAYDVPSFKVTYSDWTVTGAFHYSSKAPWSCKVHSDSLPFKGLPGMLPKLKNTTIDGGGSLDLSIAESRGKGLPFLVNGQVVLKGVGISLPKESYLQSMNGTIYCANDVIRIPDVTFKAFDGVGAVGVTFNGASSAYSYGFRLQNVNAQKAVDASIDAYVTTKDYSKYKDMLYGTMNLAYSGYGKGTSGDAMMASQVGSGNYNILGAKIKGGVVKTINGYLKDQSDEMGFDKIDGVLAMKDKVFTFTANTLGKVGAIRERGGIDVVKMAYSPDMSVQCDIKKDFINSDSLKSALPGGIGGLVKDPSFLEDDNGNVPVDLKFTGPVSDNHYSWDTDRIGNNVKKHLGQAVQNSAKPVIQNLGNQLKSLFH